MMRKSMKVLAFFALFLLIASSHAVAQLDGAKKPGKDPRVLHGIFVAENGERTELSAAASSAVAGGSAASRRMASVAR